MPQKENVGLVQAIQNSHSSTGQILYDLEGIHAATKEVGELLSGAKAHFAEALKYFEDAIRIGQEEAKEIITPSTPPPTDNSGSSSLGKPAPGIPAKPDVAKAVDTSAPPVDPSAHAASGTSPLQQKLEALRGKQTHAPADTVVEKVATSDQNSASAAQ